MTDKIKNKKQEIRKLVQTVLDFYRKQGRHDLPWRNLPAGRQEHMDPYHILVSEVMLQQTQVHRVIPYYEKFIKRFPTTKSLAKAELLEVLTFWSGLGYNRRAKFLWEAAQHVEKKYKGQFPRAYEELRALPGVGEYTAKAVRIFAFNEPEVPIETNIRTVFFHHFHHFKTFHLVDGRQPDGTVGDGEILKVAQVAARGQDPRGWHWALMDYGAHLKQSGVRLNKKSAHYTKQKKFEGSLRQVRGAILKAHIKGTPIDEVKKMYPEKFATALASLQAEGLIK